MPLLEPLICVATEVKTVDTALVLQAYVYLLVTLERVVLEGEFPNANIPLVLLPAAAPNLLLALALVPATLVSLE